MKNDLFDNLFAVVAAAAAAVAAAVVLLDPFLCITAKIDHFRLGRPRPCLCLHYARTLTIPRMFG